MTDYSGVFDKVFDDSCRIVMAIVPGNNGVELQFFNRDENTERPELMFLLKDVDLEGFMLARSEGNPCWLWSAGVTDADIWHYRETGEKLPGVRLNGLA